jgi:hypothetical protein
VKLLERVSALLAQRASAHAVIGAAALAAHGVARATADLDLLALDLACLDPSAWRELRGAGASVEIRRGDDADPLAGVVRVSSPGERPVDVVVGKGAWQASLLSRATPLRITREGVAIDGAT